MVAGRVVVIDDTELFRGDARRLLEARDYVVIGEADRAESALRVVRQMQPDVVLLDVNLPGRRGLDLCRELVQLAPKATILLMSADLPTQSLPATARRGASSQRMSSPLPTLPRFWPAP
jgi:DNA-binding NarL/FixJ family response regulator